MAKKELDFPIFSIHGDEELEKEMSEAIEVRIEIDEITEDLEALQVEIDDIGKKLNMYINNTIKLETPFDYELHTLVFNDKDEACVYEQKKLEDLMEEHDYEDEEELFSNLPEAEIKFNLNKKQINRCLELINKYNQLILTYDICVYEFNEDTQYYNELIDSIKEILKNTTPFIKLSGKIKTEDIEMFDDEKHELLIVEDSRTSEWKFLYVRHEDKQKFFNAIGYEGDN